MKTPIKKLLLMAVLCLGFSNYLKAQVNPEYIELDTSFNVQMNHVFGNLDMSRVPNGILEDYGMQFTNLSNYDGTNMADSTLLNKKLLYEIYNTLFSARVTSAAYATLPNIAKTDSVWYSKRKPGTVAVCGLFYQYAKIDANAVSNSKITLSGDQLFDKYTGGVWQNPYQTSQTIGFAPATEVYIGQSFNILLPDSLWLSNSKSIVNHIEIDASDGLGYRIITPNTPLPVSYADTGLKTWNLKLYLIDNNVLQSHTRLMIKADIYGQNNVPPAPSSFVDLSVSTGRPPGTPGFFYVTSNETFEGKHALGEITVKLAPGHSGIQKPLIIVEGFDPGIYTSPEIYTGSSSITNFINDILLSDSLSTLLNSQYDLIYIDYRDGTDDIHRNALLVKDVIRWVNSVKTPLSGIMQKNVVIGQSMGGLVARYALKKMEDAGENHDTGLYINHDGPQQGANVPIAYQYMVNHTQNLYLRYGTLAAGAYEIVSVITSGFGSSLAPNIIPGALSVKDTPAARQMLVNYIDGGDNLDNSVHDAWQTELTNLGYPSQGSIRNIAISNGSECSKPQAVGVGGQLLAINGEFKTSLLGQLVSVVGFGAGIIAEPKLLVGFAPGADKITVNFVANASSAYGGNQVYSGNIHYSKKLFGVTLYSTDLTNRVKVAPSGQLGLESFAGSFVQQDPLGDPSAKNWFYNYNTTVVGPINFCFVPVPSALDISASPTNLSQPDYLISYSEGNPPVAPKNTPFANFITAYNSGSNNEQHITFETRNGKWLAAELNADGTTANPYPQATCVGFCSSSPVTGLDVLDCATSSATYTLNATGISNITSITWAAIKGLSIVGANNGTSVTVSANNSGNNFGVVSATIVSDCGSVAVSKRVTLTSAIPGIIQANTRLNRTSVQVVVGFSGPHFDFNYYIDGVLVTTSPLSNLYVACPCGGHVLGVSANTDCGETAIAYQVITIPCGSGYSLASKYAYYPNPANQSITVQPNAVTQTDVAATQVSAQSTSAAGIDQAPYEVQIYNEKGKVLKSVKSISSKAINIDIHDLTNGTYYLHIIKGSDIVMKQIIIQH